MARSTPVAIAAGAAVAALAMMGAAVAVVGFGVRARPVLSASMEPAFGPGALLLTRPLASDAVQAGDVIVFRPPSGAGEYAHRVVSASRPPDRPVLTTRGDANPAEDPWRAQLDGDSVPVVIASVPHLGRAALALGQPGPRVALALFAGLVLVVAGTRSILGTPTAEAPAGTRPAGL